MRQVLVSGAGGFIGRALVSRLRDRGARVVSIGTRPDSSPEHILIANAWTAADWSAAIEKVRPDVVFHLAGATRGDERLLWEVNFRLAVSLVGALRSTSWRPILVVAGSAAEYGEGVADGEPVTEEAVCAPVTPYGAAKLAQTGAILAYGAETSARVVVARIFNPIGPGMPSHLALADFARQVAGMDTGGVLRVGNLDVSRDFMEVGDVADRLVALAQNARSAGVVNVCSGEATCLRDLVDAMISASAKPIKIELDPARVRANERRVVIGSPAKLAALTGAPAVRDVLGLAVEILAFAQDERRRA